MTRANDKAVAAMHDAERRVKRKLKRLQKKGVRTGSISPLGEVDTSNTRAVKRYTAELERFISRQTRFIAGRDGTPIPWGMWRDYRRLERAWNREHARWWGRHGGAPFVTSAGASDMTIAERSAMGRVKGAPLGGVGYQRELTPEKVRGVNDLIKRTQILQKELSPTYQKERVKNLRKNLLAHVDSFNDERLPSMIRSLTNEQLVALQNTTNFVPLYYRYMSTNIDITLGDDIDAQEHEAQVEHLKLTIEQIKKLYPRGVREKQLKSKRKGKRTKYRIKAYGYSPENAKEKAHEVTNMMFGE